MRFLIFTFIMNILLTPPVVAQELLCEVNVNLESIPSAQRDYLRTFKSDIERYLNSTRFTNENLEEKIRCTFDIFFKSAPGNNQYSAQVFIASQRPIYKNSIQTEATSTVIRIMDENWEFTYTPNQRMVQDDFTVDPLCDFLDFYAYIIIGYDLDSYVPLSGTSCFQKALNICQQLASTQGGKYWQQMSTSYNRYGLASELSNPSYEPFRLAMNNYYFDGLDKLSTNQSEALDAMLDAIEVISTFRKTNPSSVSVKQFFDAKYREIAEVFLRYPNRDVYDQLSRFDPEHRSTYQEMKTKP